MRIRDFINGKIQEAENITKYTTTVILKQNSNNKVAMIVDFQDNGSASIGPVDLSECGGNVTIGHKSITAPSHLYYTQNISVDHSKAISILNEIVPILDIIPQITSYQSSNSSYATQNSQKSQEVSRKNQEISQKSQEISWKNQEVSQKSQEIAQKNREITEVQQKIAGLQSQENSLHSQINSFQISNNIKTLNAKQKAHILQKIWGNGDADSVSVINAIKQYGFDPHYVHKNGQSLAQLALSRNDVALFDLLIANKIDFNTSSANLTIFKLVLNSGNSNFISKMFATGQDFTKSLLDVVLKDDAVMLGKIFSHKVELSQVSYSGYSLLQLALKNGCYKAAEQILQSNPQSINQLTTKGISALQLAMLTDDKLGYVIMRF